MPSPPSSELNADADTGAPAGAPPREAVQAAREVVGVMMRTIKTLRLYDARNPIYKKALRDMGERLRGHVGRTGDLAISVTRDGLMLGDEVLHTDDDPKEGMAFRLYTDGVRRITFREGTAAEEAKAALEILARGTALTADDDDIVTLLWNADLPNIEVEAVEDEPPAFQLMPAHHADAAQPQLDQAAHEGAGQPAAGADAGAGAGVGAVPEAEGPQRVHFGQESLSVFVLGPKDLAYVEQLVEREAAQDPAQDLVQILGDILSIDDSEDDFVETVDICAGLLVDFLSQGRMGDAGRLVTALAAVAEGREELGPEARRSVDAILDGLGEGGLLESLKDGLAQAFAEAPPQGGAPDPARVQALADLKAYLDRIRKTDARQVLAMAAEMTEAPLQEALCDTVARVCRDDRTVMLEMLSDPDPVSVQCALRVLGRVASQSDLLRLAQVSRHPDVNVRRSAVEAICRIAGGAHIQLYPYLTDADSRIRRRALAMMEVSHFRQGLETLMNLVGRPVFATWEMNERRAVFNCIGTLGGDDVLGFFNGHMGRRRIGMLGGRRDEDLALCAVAGLKAVGTDAARELLETHARKGSRKVRAACEWALREMKAMR
jgi:HEAT repeat protein